MISPAPQIVRGPSIVPVYSGMTIGNAMSRTARDRGQVRQWFWSDGELTSVTLYALDAQAQDLAARLQIRGVGKGDRVAVQMPNRVETAVIYRACLLLGATLVPIVHIYGPAELSFILRQSAARLLFVPDRWRHFDFHERVAQLTGCPDLREVVFIGVGNGPSSLTWRKLLDGPSPDLKPVNVEPSDIALLLYTSGTTSAPKGVRHSHRTLLGELEQRSAAGETSNDKTFSPWPAGHIGGFGSLIYAQILGNEAVFMDRWSAPEGAELIARFQVTRMAGVPVVLNELLDAAEEARIDLSCVKSFMVGAANVPPALVERAEGAGISVFRCYGSSEHPTVSASSPAAPIESRAQTDGAILAGAEVRLLDEGGRDVAFSGEGEILTRGAELFEGYEDAALNAEAFFEDGWFRTGDIGTFRDGNLVITDRKKDIIIRGGENISSKEVEDVLAGHPLVHEAAAFAVPHQRLGEGVAVAVILRPGASLGLDEVRIHFARCGVARAKCPEKLYVVQELPRTPNGKVKKFELRTRFG